MLILDFNSIRREKKIHCLMCFEACTTEACTTEQSKTNVLNLSFSVGIRLSLKGFGYRSFDGFQRFDTHFRSSIPYKVTEF